MSFRTERPADTWILQSLAAQILREVSRRCRDAGIDFVFVKGAVTAHWLYEDVAERSIADVDIRIRPRDVARFRRMADLAGWRCQRRLRSYRSLVYTFGEWTPLTLDVECEVGPPGLCALRVDEILARAGTLSAARDLQVPIPELHDHAVLLTVNAFKDKISGAAPHAREDLSRVVSHRDFHAEVFVERVIRARACTMAWLVASWMETQGDTAWAILRHRLEENAPIRRGYARVFQALMAGGGRSQAMRLLARAGADAPWMRAKAIVFAVACETEIWLRGHVRPERL
jgi:hypothetical protein